MAYQGSCHCGSVKYSIEAEIDSLLQCNCSICTKRGYLLWFVPMDKVSFEQRGELSTYTFNKHQIKHQFCPTCGCAPFGVGAAPDGTETAAINARCLDGVDLSQFSVNHYNGRDI